MLKPENGKSGQPQKTITQAPTAYRDWTKVQRSLP